MQIFAETSTGKIITLDVKLTDSIYGLKQKISNEENRPPHKLKLFYEGQLLDDLHSTSTVESNNIQPESTIQVEVDLRLSIHIKMNSKTLTLHLLGTETIATIKQMVHDIEGHLIPRQRLIYRQVLEDDKSLDFYGVKEDANIYLMYKLFGSDSELDGCHISQS